MKLNITMVAPVALLAACLAEPEPTAGSGGVVAVEVASLSLSGVTNAQYDLEVRNATGVLVWARTLDARTYGDGAGSLSYVGPCDADPAENPNTVSLTLNALYEGAAGNVPVAPGTYQNPGTLTRSVTCRENEDVRATFDLTLLRQANQGFFDVAVNFSDIYCSAKLDCVDDEGAPLALLFDGATRGRTLVVAVACTGDIAAGGDTWLYRSDVDVVCEAGSATVSPGAGPGNLVEGSGITSTGVSPLFGAAVYKGAEDLGFNKRYWNVALGLAAGAAGCSVSATATAAPDELVGGATPADTTWPLIVWDVELTAPTTGALLCTNHPVGGAAPNDGVYTAYTALDTPAVLGHAFGPSQPTLALCTPGQTGCPLASCQAIVDADLDDGDGLYAIDPDGANLGAPAFDVWCDMQGDGGGWTLSLSTNELDTPHNLATSVSDPGVDGWVPLAGLGASQVRLDIQGSGGLASFIFPSELLAQFFEQRVADTGFFAQYLSFEPGESNACTGMDLRQYFRIHSNVASHIHLWLLNHTSGYPNGLVMYGTSYNSVCDGQLGSVQRIRVWLK